MKRILMIAVALLPLMLMAQARIGIVNSQQLFDLMPEKAAAEAKLKALNPVLFEVLPLSLEEVFVYEMGQRGYEFSEVLKQEVK